MSGLSELEKRVFGHDAVKDEDGNIIERGIGALKKAKIVTLLEHEFAALVLKAKAWEEHIEELKAYATKSSEPAPVAPVSVVPATVVATTVSPDATPAAPVHTEG